MAPGGSYSQVPGSPSQLPLRHARQSSHSSRRGIPSRWRTGLICSTVALLLLGAIAHQCSPRSFKMEGNELETLRGEEEGSERMGGGWSKVGGEAKLEEMVPDEAEVETELQAEKGELAQEWAEVGDEKVGADAKQDVGPSEVEEEEVVEKPAGRVSDSVLSEEEEVDQEIHRIEADEALRANAEQEEESCLDTVKNALSMPSFWYIRCEWLPTIAFANDADSFRSALQRPAPPLSPSPLDPPTIASHPTASLTPYSQLASSEAFPPPNPTSLAPRPSSPSPDLCFSTTRPTTRFESLPILFFRVHRTDWT
jgi:hypothetical protein